MGSHGGEAERAGDGECAEIGVRPGAKGCADVLVVGETTTAACASPLVLVDAGRAGSDGGACSANCCLLLRVVVVSEP